jgi:thiol-disulfide isomerase/thioredoxin
MKTIHFLFLTLLCTIALSAQNGAISIKPKEPKAGDQVTLTYTPKKSPTGLANATKISANVLFISSNMPEVQKYEMKQKGSKWNASFIIPDNCPAYAVKFVSEDKTDDNNEDVWKFEVYGKDKKPVENSNFFFGIMHMRGDVEGFKVKKSSDMAKVYFAKELSFYPDNINSLFFTLNQKINDDKSDEAKTMVQNELLNRFYTRPLDDKKRQSLLNLFPNFGLEKKTKELKDSLIALNPKGYFAMKDKINSAAKNPSVESIEKIMTDFPNMEANDKTYLTSILVQSMVKEKAFDKANEVISKGMIKDGSLFNSLAWPLIEKGENLDMAVNWVSQGIQLMREDMLKRKKNTKVGDDGVKQRDNSFGMILDTYAYGLEQQGKTNEALAAYEESFYHMDGNEESINERYVQLLTKSGNNTKVLEVVKKCLENQKANTKILENYKIAYKNIYGSSEKAEAELAKITSEAKAKAKEELKKQMLNKEAPDFNLKDFDGNSVKLSDLKGKIVVVDFWATWCGPCKMSFPALQKMHEKYKDNPNILILALDTWEKEKSAEEKEKKVKEFINGNKYTFKVLFDTDDIVSKYGVTGIPTKFVIDQEGKMQFKSVGFGGEQKMMAEMEAQFDILLEK